MGKKVGYGSNQKISYNLPLETYPIEILKKIFILKIFNIPCHNFILKADVHPLILKILTR